MMRVVEAAQVIVLAVAGQRVLGQIVGADAEEIDLLRQTVAVDGGGGRLDHDADLDLLAVGDALLLQLALDFLAELLGLADLPDGGDHREHDAQLAEGGGAEEGAQLGLEDLGPGQADAQCAHAHGGVILLRQIKVADLLVSADVQRADDDLLAVHVGQDLLVGLKLLILGRIIARVQIEELGAEQTDAAAVIDLHGVDILGRADVAVDADGLAVLRHIGLTLQRFQQTLEAQLLIALFHQAVAGVVIGVDDERAGAAVRNGGAALILGLERIAHADDGGDTHCAGQNGGVARAGAARRDKAQNLGLVKLDRLGRGQIVSAEQHRHIGGNAALYDAAEDAQDALADILDISGAGLHVGIVHRGEHLGKLLGRVGNGGLGVHLLVENTVLDGLLIVEVLSHHLVRFKQHGGLVTGIPAGLLGQIAQLLNGAGLGTFKAMPLGIGILYGIALDLCCGAAVKIERANADTGGNALALNRDHWGSLPFHQIKGRGRRIAVAAAAVKSELQMLVEELLHGGGGSLLVSTLDLDGDGVAALDAHAHQGHQAGGVNRLAVLVNDGDGALAALGLFCQHAGRTRMDADGFFDGIGEFFHSFFLP